MGHQDYKKKVGEVKTIYIWCEICEKQTPHYPILNSDEFIARWMCSYSGEHELQKTVGYADRDKKG